MNVRNRHRNNEEDAADQASQHLSDLLGVSVAGKLPGIAKRLTLEQLLNRDFQMPKTDLETELFQRMNMPISSLVILCGLIKGNEQQKALIMENIKPDYLDGNSFPAYLYRVIVNKLHKSEEVLIPEIEKRIPNYGPDVYGQPSKEESLKADYFTWIQLLSFKPTPRQVNRAIELRRLWAKDKGLFS